MRTQNFGFTMIELMVTLAVMAILLVLAAPNFMTWIGNAKVRSVAESMQNDIKLVQIEAIKRNKTAVFALTNAVPAYAAATSTTGNHWYAQVLDDNKGLLLSSTVASQSKVLIAADGGFICFNSMGRLSSASNVAGMTGTCTVGATAATPVAFNLSISGGDRPLRVQVLPGGKVRICDPNKTLSSTQPDGCS